MTFEAVLRKARLEGASQIYRLSVPWHQRGIRTSFNAEDRAAKDWEVCPEEEK